MADYDKYYTTENLFGEAYPELISFFKDYKPKGKLLDVGCGQGRDAITLAKLGYEVTGIDNSEIGIMQMLRVAESKNLKIEGIVDNIYKFENFGSYDIVLLDSMFHFQKKDKVRETNLISRIAKALKPNALLCICILDTGSKVKILKETIKNSNIDFEVSNDPSLLYHFEDKASGHKSKLKYRMYIVKRL